jgi:hypothetical protein
MLARTATYVGIARAEMSQALHLDVPIKVDVAWGPNLLDLSGL